MSNIDIEPQELSGSDDDYLRTQQAFHAASYNRIVLTISGGALALSVSFVGGAESINEAAGWALAGWILLIASLLLVAWSHFLAANAFTASYHGERGEERSGARWSALLSGVALAGGLLCLAVFAFHNI